MLRAKGLAIAVFGILMGLSYATTRASSADRRADSDLPTVLSDAPQTQNGVSKAMARFHHGNAKHRTLECGKCHKISPEKIDDTQFPGHQACIDCHNLALEALSRPVLFCGICHQGRPVSTTQAALFQYPKPNVKSQFGIAFSHPSHTKPEPIPEVNVYVASKSVTVGGDRQPLCMDCHTSLPQLIQGKPEITSATGHPACFACHGQNAIKPPTMFQCGECHKLDTPGYPHLFGSVDQFRHADHIYDTRPVLKINAGIKKSADYLCSECHVSAAKAVSLSQISLPQVQYCNDCHNGRLGLPDALARHVVNSLQAH